MSVPVLTFFNNKGGVGKTSLIYHLAWMFSELGWRVLAVDIDSQANLTTAFVDDECLENLWTTERETTTVFRAVKPLLDVGDFSPVDIVQINPKLGLIPGDIGLAGFEDELSKTWTAALDDRNKTRPFRILTAFWRLAQDAASRFSADIILFDAAPNLGAINRSAMLASNHIIVPLGADLFSLQGLRNLGPTVREWRSGWEKRTKEWEKPEVALPKGDMNPLGYVTMNHSVLLSRPVRAYTRWLEEIPGEFRRSVLAEKNPKSPKMDKDPFCLAMLKNYRSLMPLGQEARKPIFLLKAADGAIGAHSTAVKNAYADFEILAKKLAVKIKLPKI